MAAIDGDRGINNDISYSIVHGPGDPSPGDPSGMCPGNEVYGRVSNAKVLRWIKKIIQDHS